MNKLSMVLMAALMTGCLVPVAVGEDDAGVGGGSGGGTAGGGGAAGGGTGGGTVTDADLTAIGFQVDPVLARSHSLNVQLFFKNTGTVGVVPAKYGYALSTDTTYTSADPFLRKIARGYKRSSHY